MSTPNPVYSSWVPDGGTILGAVGGAISVIAVWALETYTKVSVPTPVAAAIGTLATVGLGYLHPQGRKPE